MRERLARFMYGRYGNDNLNRFLSGFSFFLLIVYMITKFYPLWMVAVILLVLVYIRMFSRNIQKRYQENQKYLQVTAPVTNWMRLRIKHLKERKTHRFFICPTCRQKVRVPKGKGNICITCPKCRTQFQKRS